MKQRDFALLFSILGFIIALVSPMLAYSEPPSKLDQRVMRSIKAVRRASTKTTAMDAAERLATLVHGSDPRSISDDNIHALAFLLRTDNDGVRLWVAEALGDFGSRARFAVPELLNALNHVECLRVDVSSEDTIRSCIEKTGVVPPPRKKCNYDVGK